MKRKLRLFSLKITFNFAAYSGIPKLGICRAAVLGNQTKFESLKQTLCTQIDLSIPNLKFYLILFLLVYTGLVFAIG